MKQMIAPCRARGKMMPGWAPQGVVARGGRGGNQKSNIRGGPGGGEEMSGQSLGTWGTGIGPQGIRLPPALTCA